MVEDIKGYSQDMFITTKQYYKFYCEQNFEEFLKLAKAGETKLNKL